MPTYDYVCEEGHMKEVLHGMGDNPKLYCRCGKPLRRTVSVPIVKFNGSGFYSTDNK